jgi:diguanylate cyclase (GGDEF)-like protein/PAS domain S-box-containing protein
MGTDTGFATGRARPRKRLPRSTYGRLARVASRRDRQLIELLNNSLSTIVETSDDAIVAKTLDCTIVSWNPGAERIYGYSAAEVIGKPISILFPAELKNELGPIMKRIRQGKRFDHYETVRLRKDRTRIEVSVTVSPIRDAKGRILGASSIARDITNRKRAEERMRFLALHDPLTGLANYRKLMDVLETELERSARSKRPFSLLLLDLDGLKVINDKHGHLVGSRALCRLADALRRHCRAIDTAARYGGDEFVVLLVETDRNAALTVARRIRDRVARDREKPPISVSVGVTVCPEDGETVESLLAAADRELYKQKDSHRVVTQAGGSTDCASLRSNSQPQSHREGSEGPAIQQQGTK